MTSEYKAKLKGWAVDRAIQILAAGGGVVDLERVKASAKNLAEFAYVPDEDVKSLVTALSEAIKLSKDPIAIIEQLEREMAFAREDIERQANPRAAAAN